MHEKLKLDMVVGRQKKRVTFTEKQFEDWVEAVIADRDLSAKVLAAKDGKTHWLDLDEGDAGIFEHRVLEMAGEILSKMDIPHETDREIVSAVLMPDLLAAVQERIG